MAGWKKGKVQGSLLMTEELRNSPLHAAIKEVATVNLTDSAGCVDIWVGERLVVQWLSDSDIINLSSRAQTRLTELSKLSVTSLVIAEISPGHEQLLRTLQQQVVLKLHLRLVTVSSPAEAASFICQLMKQQHRPGLSPAQRRQPPPDPALMHLVQCLPSIGQVKAEALLATFHSVHRIATASEEELSRTVGQPAATAVHQFLHHPHLAHSPHPTGSLISTHTASD